MKNIYKNIVRFTSFILFCIWLSSIFPASALAENDISKAPSDFVSVSEEELQEQLDWLVENGTSITDAPEQTEVGAQRTVQPRSFSLLESEPQLPKSVDNSKLKYFPPIMDQGNIGSCYAFAQAYTYTHMRALFHNIDVKNDGNKSIFSPQFIYNTCIFSNFERSTEKIISDIDIAGCLTLDEYPYLGIENTALPTTAEQWRSAIKNRAQKYLYISDISIPDNFILLKRYLCEGYVFDAGGRLFCWKNTIIKDNINSHIDDSEVNLIGLYNIDSDKLDAHAITIVGYNDDIWMDINNNNIIDSGELGAFKVANSWSDKWANNGFAWMSYSMIGEKSIYNFCYTILPKEPGYTPELLAEVTINSSCVKELEIKLGWSEHNSSNAEYSFSYNLANRGNYSFDTSTNYTDATFAFDLTTIIEKYNLDLKDFKYDWYIDVRDIYDDDNVTTVKAFKLTGADGNILAEYDNSLDSYKLFDFFKRQITSTGSKLPIALNGQSAQLKIPFGKTKVVPGNYIVEWNANGGTPQPDKFTVTKNDAIAEPTQPVREGYKFSGWYNGSSKISFPLTNVTKDITVTAKWTKDLTLSNPYLVPDVNNSGFYIDLSNETLIKPEDEYYSFAYYSINGGATWTKGYAVSLPTLLNKKMHLMLTDFYDTKLKKPAEDAVVIEFPPVEARPATNPDGLIIDYAVCADPANVTAGAWTLVKKGETQAYTEGIEIALSLNGKTPVWVEDGNPWFKIDKGGVEILPYGSAKQTYLARTAPVVTAETYVPASKTFKLSPLTQQKQTLYKADYSNEVIKIKEGMRIFSGTADDLENTPLTEKNTAQSAQMFAPGKYYTATAADSKTGISLTEVLNSTDLNSGTTQSICIWIPATAKAPATKTQEYVLAVRNDLTPQIFEGVNGKVTVSSKLNLEFLNPVNGKWGGLPVFTDSARVTEENAVRVKNLAKATGSNDSSQLARSKAGVFTVLYGIYTPAEAKTAKRGVLSVSVGNTYTAKTPADLTETNPYLVPDVSNSGFYINLNNETLIKPEGEYYGFTYYSINGGTTWAKGTTVNLPSLLNKQMHLMLTDLYDTKLKKPSDNALIIEFPTVQARPATNPNGLIIDYAVCADPTNVTAGAWTLVKKGGTQAYTEGIEIALTLDGTTPAWTETGIPWFKIDSGGIEILPYGAVKQTYLARTAPIVSTETNVPASKTFKLSPLTQQKQTIYKADYKNEVIKIKAGASIFGGTSEELTQISLTEAAAASAQEFASGLYYNATTADSKTGINISEILNSTAQSVCIWIPATAKTPATETQEYIM